MLLLGQKEISKEILEMLAYLPLSLLFSFRTELFKNFMLNYVETYCLRDFHSLLATNLS